MIIEYEGQEHDFRFEDITVKQAMKIEKHTGAKLTDWGSNLEEGNNWVALQALGWLVLFGGTGAVDDADFKVGPFAEAFAKAIASQAEAAREAEAPVPTGAGPASSGPEADAGDPASSPPSSVPA